MLTIIGAEAFHGPVRDGKEWFHFAMVVRHDLSPAGIPARPILEEKKYSFELIVSEDTGLRSQRNMQ